MSKMAMVICHAHFNRLTNGGSYTRILKELSARNNLPYVTPLDTNADSRKILQTLSEQCEEYDHRVESETEEYRNSSEEENNADSEDKTENLSEKKTILASSNKGTIKNQTNETKGLKQRKKRRRS